MSERLFTKLALTGSLILAGCTERQPVLTTSSQEPTAIRTSITVDESLVGLVGCEMDVEIERDDLDSDIDGLTYAETSCIVYPQEHVLTLDIHGDGENQGIGLIIDEDYDKGLTYLVPYINSDKPYGEYTITNTLQCHLEGEDISRKCAEITFTINFQEPKPGIDDVVEETDKIDLDDYIPDIIPPISLIGCDIKTTIDRDTSPVSSGLLLGDTCVLQNNTNEDIGWTINGGDPGVGYHISSGMVSANSQRDLQTYINPNHKNGNYNGEAIVKCSVDDTYKDCGKVSYDITLQD